MKKADKFDPAKWLVENKITFQSRLDEMEKFDATAYQEKNNFEPKQYGDKYNVQFEVKYVNGEIKTAVVYPPTKSKSEFAGKLNEDNENKEFNIDFPSLDYNTVVDFIENKGYDIVSDYYDKGFDADEGDTFVGIFNDHIEVMDPNGRVKKYRYTK
jgi:hypothetical protein